MSALMQNNIDRECEITAFLARYNLSNCKVEHIASDASRRCYRRLFLDGVNLSSDDFSEAKTIILMDAPPLYESVSAYIKITDILRSLNLSAPQIYAKDEKLGLLLLEDFGNNIFAKKLSASNYSEKIALYKQAIDTIVELQEHQFSTDKQSIEEYNHNTLMREAELFPDWYLQQINHPKVDDTGFKHEYMSIIAEILPKLKTPNDYLVLRDYHAENIFYLSHRQGVKNIGLIDFQDALIGNRMYDVVSILEDARIDVAPAMREELTRYYLDKANEKITTNREDLLNDYYILAAQRNLKILGIFARLNIRDNKPNYTKLLPRVAEYLKHDLTHPILAPLKNFLAEIL